MKTKKAWKMILLITSIMAIALIAVGCNEADRVSENVSKEADNFNVVRRVAVLNTISNKPVFEMTGRMSIKTSGDKLYIIVETSKGKYKKHIVGLNKATTTNTASPYEYFHINYSFLILH